MATVNLYKNKISQTIGYVKHTLNKTKNNKESKKREKSIKFAFSEPFIANIKNCKNFHSPQREYQQSNHSNRKQYKEKPNCKSHERKTKQSMRIRNSNHGNRGLNIHIRNEKKGKKNPNNNTISAPSTCYHLRNAASGRRSNTTNSKAEVVSRRQYSVHQKHHAHLRRLWQCVALHCTEEEEEEALQARTMRTLILLQLFLLVLVASPSNVQSISSRLPCSPIKLPNGRTRYRQKSGFVQFLCNKGYLLAGERYMKCAQGRWEGEVPSCVRNTCKKVSQPLDGFVYPSHRGGVLNFFCKAGYEIHGPPIAYCNGTAWSTYLPTCIHSERQVSLSCDFESDDLCGWTHDINHNFDWIRHRLETPSHIVGTGPSRDHTAGLNGTGHYMYLEASGKNLNDVARLISPTYRREVDLRVCFQFYYNMHGATVNELRVYLKKVGDRNWDFNGDDAQFITSGNQGLKWHKVVLDFGVVDDDFQIVFEGLRGQNYMSDIALDDVLLIENCTEKDLQFEAEVTVSDLLSSTSSDMTDSSLWTSETTTLGYLSCDNACGFVYYGSDANSVLCSCHDNCLDNLTCCPDYPAYCVFDSDDSWTSASSSTIISTTTATVETSSELIASTAINPSTRDSHVTNATTVAIVTKITPITAAAAATKKEQTKAVTTPTPAVWTTKSTNISATSTITTMTTAKSMQPTTPVPVITTAVYNNKKKAVDVSSGGWLTNGVLTAAIAVIVVSSLMVLLLLTFRWRRSCLYRNVGRPLGGGGWAFRNCGRSNRAVSESDVRFLPSDEALDFTLAY